MRRRVAGTIARCVLCPGTSVSLLRQPSSSNRRSPPIVCVSADSGDSHHAVSSVHQSPSAAAFWPREPLVHHPACVHEVAGVVPFVSAYRDPPFSRYPFEHLDRSFLLRRPGRLVQLSVYYEAIAVLHQHMTCEGEPCLAARSFTGKPGFRVCSGTVRPVGAFLTPEVHVRVSTGGTSRARWRICVIHGTEALHGSPCVEQRAVHAEVVIRKEIPPPRFSHHRVKEAA